MMLKRCPVTCGNQTRMSRKSFMRQCVSRQQQAKDRRTMFNEICLGCKGKKLPAELTIENIREADKMADKCENCEKEKNNLKNYQGKKVCHQCQILMIECKLRPDQVLILLSRYHPDRLPGGEVSGKAELQRKMIGELKEQNEAITDELASWRRQAEAINEQLEARSIEVEALKNGIRTGSKNGHDQAALEELGWRLINGIMNAELDNAIKVDDIRLLLGASTQGKVMTMET